jgi:transposase InsO family protein
MTETRRKFDQDFKEGAVRLAREAGKPIAQVARDLGKRDFPAQKVNTKWYGDGTEISTGEGRLHLDSVLDMASRRVLGFVLGEHHDAALTYGALTMAVAVRGGQVRVIMHTDQDSEYAAGTFQAACARLGARQSMSRPGVPTG